MSCGLAILGKDFDIDSFIEKTGDLKFIKKYKGDLVSPNRDKRLEYSYVSLIISKHGFDKIDLQIKDAINFLNVNKNNLMHISTTKEIDFATIDFGVKSTINFSKPNQNFYFPIELISICAELKIGIELSIYDYK